MRILRIILLALIVIILTGVPALAASYYATIQVQNTSGNSYNYLPVIVSVNNTYLAANGYIGATGLDTRVTSGGTVLPHMLTDNATLFVAPSVSSHSTGNYRYTTGSDNLTSFPIITGYGGYFTVADNTTIEPSGNGTISVTSYINTTAIASDPRIRGTNQSYGNTASISVNFTGTGVQSGDLLIVIFGSGGDGVGAATYTTPGFTQGFLTDWGTSAAYGMYYKVADGSETGVLTWTASSAPVAGYATLSAVISKGTYSGMPVVGGSVQGAGAPDPPNLTTGFGAINTLYIASCLSIVNQASAPANYSSNFTGGMSWTPQYRVYAGFREYTSASDNPGAFPSVSGTNSANTFAIRCSTGARVFDKPGAIGVFGSPTVSGNLSMSVNGTTILTTAGVSSGFHNNMASITASVLTWYLDGVSVGTYATDIANTADNYIFGSSATPYFSSVNITKGGVLQAQYQPNAMIIGTNLPDRETGDGVSNNGTFVWGTNPTGVSVAIGSLISLSQPGISPIGKEDNPDIISSNYVPAGGEVDTTRLQNNPLYPIVSTISEWADLSEEQIWFIGATIIILIGMGIALVKVSNHILLAGGIGFVLSGFFTAMGIYQWWMLLIFGFVFVMSILMERKPVV